MAEKKHDLTVKNSAYRLRILLCLVLVEIFAIALFIYWPETQKNDQLSQNVSFDENEIYFNNAIITRQQSSPPPPPRPQAPVPEPSDEIIEEEISLDAVEIEDYGEELSEDELGLEGEGDQAVEDPEVTPRVQHIVEPSTPKAARQAGVNVKVWVNLLIGRNGEVEEATISEIQVYDEDSGEYQTVNDANYGLAEAALDAALKWRFRPARDEGQPVKAYSLQVFTFSS